MNRSRVLLVLIVLLAVVLRFYKIDQNPPSLYWDEASLGYNAYSVLTTGRDEHNEFLPLTRFIAFGDYKPPGYIYAAVPAVWLFGLTEFAVRFPSALFGTISIVLTYLLVKKLFSKDSHFAKENIALFSAFFLAISPWHIQFSRGAFEANLAMFFNLAGVFTFIAATKKKHWFLPVSILFFVLSFYTFNANRIIAPLLVIALGVLRFKELLANKKWTIIAIVFGLILMFPNIEYFQTRESRLRFQEVSIFTNLAPLKISNARIARHNNALWARILYNRRIAYAREFFIHYFDHFRGEFLFVSGDRNPRLSAQKTGELLIVNAPFLLIGTYYLLKRQDRVTALLFAWAIIAPIPAGLAKETPHALRTLSVLPVPQIIIAMGFWHTICIIKKNYKRLLIGGYISLLTINMLFYLYNYYQWYPTIWSGEWQYGYKQMVQKVSALQDSYDNVVVTNSLGRPYIYFLFYQTTSPAKYWKNVDRDRDYGGLWTVYGMDKFRFNVADAQNLEGSTLIVARPKEMPSEVRILDEVKQLNNEVVFQIAEL